MWVPLRRHADAEGTHEACPYVVTALREVRIGRVTLSNCPIAIADLQVFDIWELNDRPALLIGMNWLRHFKRVEVDYGRKDFRFEVGSTRDIITA